MRALPALRWLVLVLAPGPADQPPPSRPSSQSLGTAVHGIHALATLHAPCKTSRLVSTADRPGPAALTGVEPGTTHTFALGACGGWFAGTLDRCPGGVRRSIG